MKNMKRIRAATTIRDAILEAIAQLGGSPKRSAILDWVAWNYGFRGWKKMSVARAIQDGQRSPFLVRTSYAHYARTGQMPARKAG